MRRLLQPEQEREREALVSVEETGRKALTEMRRLLGVLKDDGGGAARAARAAAGCAQPSRRCSSRCATRGFPVQLTTEGEPGRAAARSRPLRLPDRAGGADERAQVRRSGSGRGVIVAHGPDDFESRLRTTAYRPRPERSQRAMASSGCGNGSPCTVGSWTAGHGPAAGSPYGRGCRSERRRRECRAAVKVLIVDDQSLVRAGFRMILDAQPDVEVVGEAADGREAVEAAARVTPDVVLMDMRMPTWTGSRRPAGSCAGGPTARAS